MQDQLVAGAGAGIGRHPAAAVLAPHDRRGRRSRAAPRSPAGPRSAAADVSQKSARRRPARERLQAQRAAAGERSSTRSPDTSPRIENSASRSRSEVGRVPCPAAPSRRIPLRSPATILMRASASRPRRRTCGAPRSPSAEPPPTPAGSASRNACASRRACWASRRCARQAGVAQVGDAALARGQQAALAAQLEIDLGQLEAVAGAHHRLQPGRGVVTRAGRPAGCRSSRGRRGRPGRAAGAAAPARTGRPPRSP